MDVARTINGQLRRIPAWPIYGLGAAWAGWLFWQAASGQMGPEPIKALEHAYGLVAIKLLIATLVVTPLRDLTGVSLIRFRRALGVTCFFYVLAHLGVWAILDVQSVSRIWADIVKRPYITLGMAGFALLLPLAVTSNDRSLRRMGAAAWRRLHKLTYPAALLAGLHYVWLVKGFPLAPYLYLGVICLLLAARIKVRARLQRA